MKKQEVLKALEDDTIITETLVKSILVIQISVRS